MNTQKFNPNTFVGCISLNHACIKTSTKPARTRICLRPYKKHTRTKRVYPTNLLKQVHTYRKDGHTFSAIAIFVSTGEPYNWRSLADAYRKWLKNEQKQSAPKEKQCGEITCKP